MAAIFFLGGLLFYICIPRNIDEMTICTMPRKLVDCLRKIGQPV